MNEIKINIKRVRPSDSDISIPAYKTLGAAGLDLEAAIDEPVTIKPTEIKLIPTGFAIALPDGYEAQIRPRSGLSLKGITLINAPGTIDSDYRGEILLPIINLGSEAVTFNRGDRLAQMVINKFERVKFQLVEDLSDTERGSGGFGSTSI